MSPFASCGHAAAGALGSNAEAAASLFRMEEDAPLLILDEPTTNLDAVTEHAIVQTLQTLIRGRTTLLITHRLASWMDITDEVLTLQASPLTQRMTTQVTSRP